MEKASLEKDLHTESNGDISVMRRKEPNHTDVLVIGAGVGGLITALECWRKGFNIRILERSASNITTGDSLAIGPSVIRHIYEKWPEMAERCEEIAYDPYISFCNLRGQRLFEPRRMNDMYSSKIDPKFMPKKSHRHFRPKFHNMLLEHLGEIGVEVEYGHDVVEYFEDEKNRKAGIICGNGSRYTADVVVAADGLRSRSQYLVTGHEVPARSSGNSNFRTAFPIEHVAHDREIMERFGPLENGHSITELWIGRETTAFFWCTQDQISWLLQHPDEETNSAESWSHHVSPSEALKFTSTIPEWPEYANRVIKATPPGALVDWKLMWRDPQPNWVSPNGLVVQLGDAAHAFLPTSGNGATQAIEDGISLAACIDEAIRLGGKEDLKWATRVHNLLRFERTSALQAFGIENREKYKSYQDTGEHHQTFGQSGEEKQKHNPAPFLNQTNSTPHTSPNTHEPDNKNKKDATNTKNPLKPPPTPLFGRWIVEHDPEQYAYDKYSEAYNFVKEGRQERGERFVNTNLPPGFVYKPWTTESLLERQSQGVGIMEAVGGGDWT